MLEAAAPLEHRHLVRCSQQLRSYTAAVEAWGRARWPGARVMHELPVGGCRLDVAFVLPDHLVGVEIKSERDTLARLPGQMRDYLWELPEVWIAMAPKWVTKIDVASDAVPWRVGRVVVDAGEVCETLQMTNHLWKHAAHPDLMLTTRMLHLLWRSEIATLAASHGIKLPARLTLPKALPILARALTGQQIVTGVCGLLRAREKTGGYVADPPTARAAPSPDPKGSADALGDTAARGRDR